MIINKFINNDYYIDNKIVTEQVDRRSDSNKLISNSLSKGMQEWNRVSDNYDRLSKAKINIKETSKSLNAKILSKEFTVVPRVIIGSGDTATTLWLENRKNQEFDGALMIGEGMGNWKHDYTLAQTHSLLERPNAPSNPSDFTSDLSYTSNTHVNARHLYQSNVINLAETNAPLLSGAKVLRVEKKENHLTDWKSSENSYRVVVSIEGQEKAIYTHQIDFCTGLGGPRNIFPGTYLGQNEFTRLNQFDQNKQFTPIVDGNQFMLTSSEEKSSGRKILIYGGGGNATACYRKAINGNDRKGDRGFQGAKNEAVWISKDGFDNAGYGNLAKNAIPHAKKRNNLLDGELLSVAQNPTTGKIIATFASKNGGAKFDVECDQFVYSIGQDSKEIQMLCSEFVNELELDYKDQVVTGVKTKDGRIHFYGASSSAILPKKYNEETRNWILKENINPDAEWPGVMPPSRAQIRKKNDYITLVNANVDDHMLILQFMLNAGIKKTKAKLFIKDLISHRKDTASGMTKKTLKRLLYNHQLTDQITVSGHCHLKVAAPTE